MAPSRFHELLNTIDEALKELFDVADKTVLGTQPNSAIVPTPEPVPEADTPADAAPSEVADTPADDTEPGLLA